MKSADLLNTYLCYIEGHLNVTITKRAITKRDLIPLQHRDLCLGHINLQTLNQKS